LERSEWEIRASSAGIVSWSVDGWEEKLTPYGFENLKGEVLKTIDVVKVKTETVNNAQVQANQKIGKIIDGSSLYVAAAISNKEAKLFYPGKEIGINFIGHSDLKDCMGEVVALNKDETETLLIVKVECPVFLLADQRVVPVKFILEKCSGIIVPHTSIYKYLNQDGLVVQKDDDYIWVPVKILFTKDSQVVIEGIKADEYYVLNPERIKNKIAYPQG
jgi:putative membrane fusion protein